MGKIIAIINFKGGVGKTSTALNLGAALVLNGLKVLLVDLDAQASLTDSLTVSSGKGISEAMDKGKAPEPVKIKEGLYLVGSSNALSLTAVKLAELRGEETYMRLSSCIEPLRGEYDYIFIDCTPSLCTLTLNALAAADETLIPVTPDILSVNGINKLFDVSNRIRDTYNGRLSSSGILFTRYDRRKTLHKTLREGMIRRFGPAVYDTVIRENVSIAEAPLKHSDVLAYAGRSNGAEDYRDLALEFLKRHNDKLHNPSIKVK